MQKKITTEYLANAIDMIKRKVQTNSKNVKLESQGKKA
ncbi:hypothetical protein ACUXIF_002341 [Enterococcus faecalis]